MNKIAVDIVLLPPEEIADLAIKLNRELSGTETNKIILGKNEGEAMPHMTLAMGCIEERDLGEIEKILDRVSGGVIIPKLEIYGIDTEKIRGDITVSSLGINKITEIQELHEKISREFKEIFSGEATREMFCGSVSMEEFSYIDDFSEIASFQKFYPHITIGLGEIQNPPISFPIKFRPAKIAICHLGDYYTCRKILWDKDLK